MMTFEESQKFTKPFTPNKCDIEKNEEQIKKGERHIKLYTTMYHRSYAEDLAKYCREHGYKTAQIVDIYNQRTGAKGGNYLSIEL
jgi:hypothetical protein